MRKRIRLILTALAVSIGLVVGFTGPALADSGTPAGKVTYVRGHPNGYFFVGVDKYFSGFNCKWAGSNTNWTSTGCGNMNDKASSVWNNGYSSNPNVASVWMFEHTGYAGGWACLSPGDTWMDLGAYIQRWNGPHHTTFVQDSISSHTWGGPCP
jgi:hypothetical protein